jgi:tRNA wybutosine-synthesizing protein 4
MKGYYNDPYISEFEHKKSHKSYIPQINRGTWTRVHCIRNNVEKVLTQLKDKEVNIVNLGAGLDSLYFCLKSKFNNFKFVEIDYDEVCFRKVIRI